MPSSFKRFWPVVLATLLALPFSMHASANSTIYKCKGPDGKISLQQGPCHGDAQQNVRTVRDTPSLNADARKSAQPRPKK